ncbi:helix-turn-helix domain-containing protein [Haloterrigena alkaliphila]|uniref:Helix-turn-helix domain-containing protein n=1 Tax=Haloterrigena alkaliphila TaxID=2816475 RepID=A0A8A2VHW9_9EURY|nr:helix-turn-helix domain-containing protein [Haloterrigena alkaliphila]QSW99964.1 helix-turn-helix domain-containing protein [Haloterrigena alkaliphila]
MRYVTYTITPQQGNFDPAEELLREHGVALQTIQAIDYLADETIVTRREIQGDREDIVGALEDPAANILEYSLFDVEGSTVLQMQYEPGELTRRILEIHQRHAVLPDYPMEYTGAKNSTLRISQIGSEAELQSLIAETRAIVDVEIERLGTYDPSDGEHLIELTDRQREVLSVAIEEGYYQEPRAVTYQDIADRLDCSAGTVGQHLRRIESRLMSTVITGGSRANRASGPSDDTDAETTPPSR